MTKLFIITYFTISWVTLIKGAPFENNLVPPNGYSLNCETGFFGCFNGMCLPQEWVCDGSKDCDEGEDEYCKEVQEKNIDLERTEPNPYSTLNKRSPKLLKEVSDYTKAPDSTLKTSDHNKTYGRTDASDLVTHTINTINSSPESTQVSIDTGNDEDYTETRTLNFPTDNAVNKDDSVANDGSSSGTNLKQDDINFPNKGNINDEISSNFINNKDSENNDRYGEFSTKYQPPNTSEENRNSYRTGHDSKNDMSTTTASVGKEESGVPNFYDSITTNLPATISQKYSIDINKNEICQGDIFRHQIKILENAIQEIETIQEKLKKKEEKLLEDKFFEDFIYPHNKNYSLKESPSTKENNTEAISKKTCPAHFQFIGDQCIYAQIYPPLSWYDALAVCKAQKGELVMIQSKDFYDKFLKQLNFDRMGIYDLWIGATNHNPSGTWQWLDGKPVVNTYIWKMHALNNLANMYLCGFMDGRSFSHIESGNCFSMKGFVCQLPASGNQSSTTAI